MAPGGLSLAQIVARLGGRLVGDADLRVHQVATLAAAADGEIAFLANAKYRKHLATTRASAVVLDAATQADAEQRGLACIVTDNPYAYYARLVALLNPPPRPAPGIDPSARVAAAIPASCSVAGLVSIAASARLGERVVIGAGCVIGEDVAIGDDTCLYPNVVVYAGCSIGQRGIVHAGAVIGADGFGFAREAGAWVKIPQIGGVRIGDDVEIGANTTIDRGALADTVIGNGVKLDNQIQIGHNVVIGDDAAFAGCVGIAGSARIGARCTIGGGGIVLGHLELADDVHVSGGTMVTKTLNTPGQYTGAYPTQEHAGWLRNAAQLKHLDALASRLRELEAKLAALESK